MVLLQVLVSHGPHYWYSLYLFKRGEVLLNFLGDQKVWHRVASLDRFSTGEVAVYD